MQFTDSEIKVVACLPEYLKKPFREVETTEYTTEDVAIESKKRREQSVEMEILNTEMEVEESGDVSAHQSALERLFTIFKEKAGQVTIGQGDELHRFNECDISEFLGNEQGHRLIDYSNGRINVLLPGRHVEIFPFYVQQRNMRHTEKRLENKSQATSIAFPIIGHENGSISFENTTIYSFTVDKIICLHRSGKNLVVFDQIGRVSVYEGTELVNAMILRDKRTKREFEEGNFLASAHVLNIKSNIVTAATAERDGQITIFSFFCKRSAAVEEITQLTDTTSAGYRELAQFAVIPGNIKVQLINIYQNFPSFMQSTLKTCILVKSGMGELRLYCADKEICGYEVEEVVDFEYSMGSVVALGGGKLWGFSCYGRDQVVEPYFQYTLDRAYDKCAVVATGEKSICFLTNEVECEIREIGLRSHNFGGDAVYREVAGL